MINKLLTYALLASIVMTGCFAASLVTVSGSFTVSFNQKFIAVPTSMLLGMK